MPRLTLRKLSIVLQLEAGLCYKQIAATLGIHPNTVRLHLREIAQQLPPKPGLSHRDIVLLYLDRLLVANSPKEAA